MLQVTSLRKEFDGVVAVDGVSLQVRRGEIFGLLGPNGAGKTTTIRTVLNIIQPDSGTITFDGKEFTPKLWDRIGYLPEERGLYRKTKVLNAILYFASLKGLDAKEGRTQAMYWLDRFGLANDAHRKVEELSKGNQQKIQIVISILHRPDLLILDEPFSGLDPVNQILLKDILLEVRKANAAIIFSTHQMEQVEKMCDNICLINKGKEVLSGSLSAIRKKHGANSVRVEFDGDGSFLRSLPAARRSDVYQNYAELQIDDTTDITKLVSEVNSRVVLRKFEVMEPSLNTIFINSVGGQEQLAEASRKPIPAPEVKKPSFLSDRRVLVASLGFVILLVLAAVETFRNLSASSPDWSRAGLFAAFAAVSAFQAFRQWKRLQSDSMKGGAQ